MRKNDPYSSSGSYMYEIQNLIKKDIEPYHAYYLLGTQIFLKDVLLKKLKSRLNAEKMQFSTETYFGDDLTVRQLQQIIEDNGFFSETKFIVIKNALRFLKKNKKDTMLPLLLQDFGNHYVILEDAVESSELNKTLRKLVASFCIVHNSSVPESQILRWVNKKFHSYQLQPPTEYVRKMIQNYKDDLDVLLHKADRICFETMNLEKPNWKQVFDSHRKTTEEIIFALSDEIIEGNSEKAYKILENLLHYGKSYDEIFYYLWNQMAFYSEVSFYYNAGCNLGETLAKMKGTHPYRVKKAYQQIGNVSCERVIRAYDYLVDVDYKRKKGTGMKLSDALIFFIENI